MGGIVCDCHAMALVCIVSELMFVRHIGNNVADYLARLAFSHPDCVWVE